MTAMLIGTALALAALVYVLFPLFRETFDSVPPGVARPAALGAEPSDEDPVGALREIEFDRATGKLADRDYEQLKATYTRRAVAAMRRAGGASAGDPVAGPVCETCGPRPEPGAVFCSECGRRLAA